MQPILREAFACHPYDYRFHPSPRQAVAATDFELARTMFARRQKLVFAVHEHGGEGESGIMNEPLYRDALRKLEIFDALFTAPPCAPPES